MNCKPDMMGKIVTVAYVMKRVKQAGEAQWLSHYVKPRAGWIVGQRTVYDGRVTYGNWEEPSYFTPSTAHTLLAVCFWPSMKPVLVRDVLSWGGTPVSPSTWAWQNLPEVQKQRVRKEIREDVVNQKRDSKGRFAK